MSQDIYQTYIGVKGVAFAWIGAATGPVFISIGMNPSYRVHLLFGIVFSMLVLLSVLDGLRALKAGSWSGVVAYMLVPLSLMLASTVYVVTANNYL